MVCGGRGLLSGKIVLKLRGRLMSLGLMRMLVLLLLIVMRRGRCVAGPGLEWHRLGHVGRMVG